MQKRYCACGQAVWVEYKCLRRAWTALLHAADRQPELRHQENRCSGCGQALHIDQLH